MCFARYQGVLTDATDEKVISGLVILQQRFTLYRSPKKLSHFLHDSNELIRGINGDSDWKKSFGC